MHYHKRQQATQNPCQLILAASIEVETSSKLSTLLSPLAPQLCCNHVCTQALQSNTMRKLLPPDLQIDTAALILAFVMMHPLFLSTQSTACLDTGTWYLSIAGHSSHRWVLIFQQRIEDSLKNCFPHLFRLIVCTATWQSASWFQHEQKARHKVTFADRLTTFERITSQGKRSLKFLLCKTSAQTSTPLFLPGWFVNTGFRSLAKDSG